jgi:hypothetical protein
LPRRDIKFPADGRYDRVERVMSPGQIPHDRPSSIALWTSSLCLMHRCDMATVGSAHSCAISGISNSLNDNEESPISARVRNSVIPYIQCSEQRQPYLRGPAFFHPQ